MKIALFSLTRLLFILVLLAISNEGMAQAPTWKVDATKYAYNMVIVGLTKVDGVETSNAGDLVAAFINGEVRGVSQPVFQTQANRNIFYLIVYSNDAVGSITLQYYDAAKNTITKAFQTLSFAPDALIGNQDKPFVWSNRATKTEASILSYSLAGQYSSRVNSDSLIIRIPVGYDKSSLVTSFTVSDGASVFIGKVKQVSGVTANDYRNSPTVSVRSEDEQTVNRYVTKFIEGEEVIPNALFPNGTQRNKTWGISHFGDIGSVSIKVFNSSGQVLFTTNNASQEWDGYYNGNKVPGGLYLYLIDFGSGYKKQGTILVVY